ncbi:DsrE family protein [Micromonospora sp. DT228]|uniref:DsrE family protein n=1 Tax=Micromonospora sp. DT228 TaxID=3393443 RepID=UPI003CEB7E6A
MRSYLLVESRTEQESPDVPRFFELGTGLRRAGHPVTVFLIQNAVIGARAPAVTSLVAAGVEVWADESSVRTRGLSPDDCPEGVRLGGMPNLVGMLMAAGCVPVWH